MIDIHTHILPGVDDGCPDLFDSILLAELAVESGVRTDDWFDIEKVSRVLAICKEVMRDLHVDD